MTLIENRTVDVFREKGWKKLVQNRHPWIFSRAVHYVDSEYTRGVSFHPEDTDPSLLSFSELNFSVILREDDRVSRSKNPIPETKDSSSLPVRQSRSDGRSSE